MPQCLLDGVASVDPRAEEKGLAEEFPRGQVDLHTNSGSAIPKGTWQGLTSLHNAECEVVAKYSG